VGLRSATERMIAVDIPGEVRGPGDPAGPAPDGERPRRRGGTIRGRMARILALPVAAVVLLLVLVAAGPVRDYRESQATTRSVGIALGVQSLVHELQNERGLASLVLGGNASFTKELTRVRGDVDSRRTTLGVFVASPGTVEARVRSALQQLDGLGPVRAATDSGAAARQATFDFYTQRIDALAGLDVGLSDVADRALGRDVALLQSLQDAAEATAQERALLSGVFSAGGFRKGEFVEFAAMRAAKQSAWDGFFDQANREQTASARYVLDSGAARVVAHFEQVAVGAADGRHVVVNPQSWWSGHTTVLDGVRQLQEHVGSVIRLRAYDLQRQATLRLGALLAVVLFCVGGSVYLAVLAALSVSRPLAALAAEAETVATERLPAAMRRLRAFDPGGGSVEPVPPKPAPVKPPRRASAEIRSVVSALNHLQEAAYRLAVEQAMQRRATLEALTNLGRRNQNLVRKQLRFISNLEREEMDPTGLSNLFELDHLATRMRRNAASLLVLTGASSPGQWTTPAPIADVMRAAVSEVEDYRRVALRRVDEALVSGAVVGSLAHLLSELIENGLRFSPPDCEVEVVGRLLGAEYLIAVIDQGVGMLPEDLQEANSRLRGEGDFMTTPSRFLGHFVVGRLAEQAGVRVELLPSPVTGVTARIHISEALLVRSSQIASGQVISAVDRGVPTTSAAQIGAGAEPVDRSVAEESSVVAVSVQAAPMEAAPVEAAPVEAAPVEAAPVEAAPVEAAPVPAASVEVPPARPDRVVVDIRDAAAPSLVTATGPAPATAHPGAHAGAGSWQSPAPATESIFDVVAQRASGPPGAGPPPAGADAAPLPDGAAGARTRNGLRVRVPGSTRSTSATSRTSGGSDGGDAPWTAPADSAWPPPSGHPVGAATVGQSAPGQLGTRLAALRSGLRRGYESPPTVEPDDARDAPSDETEHWQGPSRTHTQERS